MIKKEYTIEIDGKTAATVFIREDFNLDDCVLYGKYFIFCVFRDLEIINKRTEERNIEIECVTCKDYRNKCSGIGELKDEYKWANRRKIRNDNKH
jgi:hypothetical protein